MNYRSQCRECCQQEGRNNSAILYPQAVLEVCGWKLGSYPQVQGSYYQFSTLRKFYV